MSRVLCVDFGSTFTKAVLVDVDTGEVIGAAEHPTTIETDLLDGLTACREALPPADSVLACSSAGGGLRIGVLGNEELVTAEAGRRVALSSGGKVVAVAALADSEDPTGSLWAAEPDVVLLVGGTDGGNTEAILRGARLLASSRVPVVAAGNADAAGEIDAILVDVPHVMADNVVPRIGVLAPESARAAIREIFVSHVIGGKGLSSGPDFAAMVRGATPDLALTGVETIAAVLGKDVVVVDIGGATTDVHSVVALDPEDASLGREVVAITPVTRTVEGDLGMRWSAITTVAAGSAAEITPDDPELVAAAERRRADPGYLGDDGYDATIGRAAAVVAMRRHAGRSRVVVGPDGRVVERTGKDLREVDLLIGSGGVFRHGSAEVRERILDGVVGTDPQGWQYPERPRLLVDERAVLAAIGLLSRDHPEAAAALARSL